MASLASTLTNEHNVNVVFLREFIFPALKDNASPLTPKFSAAILSRNCQYS